MQRYPSFGFQALVAAAVAAPGFAQVELEQIPDWFPTRDFALEHGFTDPKDIQIFRSLANQSTATSIIPVSIIDPVSKTRRIRGIHANFLIEFIAKKSKLAAHTSQQRLNIAQILAKSRAFEITLNRKAELHSFGLGDSQEQYERAVQALSKYSIPELIDLFKPTSTFETEIYKIIPNKPNSNIKYALARALFDRGLCVGTGCITSALWVRQ